MDACLNCGAVLAGPWCGQCSQREVEVRPTVHELLHEALHEMVHLEIRLLFILFLFPYFAIALRRVYGGKRWLTAIKSVAILTIYDFFNLIAMAIIAYVTLRRL